MCDRKEWQFSEESIRFFLDSELQNIPLFCYDVIDSTNHQAKMIAEKEDIQTALFVANGQTAGRGRLGRSFYSPESTGIYFSFLFSSGAPLTTLTAVTPAAAVASAVSIEEQTLQHVGIKWVNDLYLDGKKVCGILTEAVTREGNLNKIIVGVGINLSTDRFPEELQQIAGSLGCSVDRNLLVATIINKLYHFVLHPEDRGFMKEYTARSIVIGRSVKLLRAEQEITGVVLGFDHDGGLLLDTGDGVPKCFTGGEISLRFS